MKISVTDLIARIKRSLGAPLVTPNITENQYIQAIDDAIKLYTEFHYNGSYKDYLIIRVNKENFDGKIGVFQMPDNVLAITKILKRGRGFDMKGVTTTDGATDMWFTSMFQGAFGGFGGSSCSVMGMSGLANMAGMLPLYTLMDMNIGEWQKTINPDMDFTFNSATKMLSVTDSKISEGYIIVCEAYVASTMGMYNGGNGLHAGGSVPVSVPNSLPHLNDFERLHEAWHDPRSIGRIGGEPILQGGLDDRWVIEYATESAKYQWGMNLTYISGVSQSAGGVKIDGQVLKEEARVQMNRLRDEIRDMGNQPIMIMG